MNNSESLQRFSPVYYSFKPIPNCTKSFNSLKPTTKSVQAV